MQDWPEVFWLGHVIYFTSYGRAPIKLGSTVIVENRLIKDPSVFWRDSSQCIVSEHLVGFIPAANKALVWWEKKRWFIKDFIIKTGVLYRDFNHWELKSVSPHVNTTRVFEIANQLLARHSLNLGMAKLSPFKTWIKSAFSCRSLYSKQNNTWLLGDMEFLFPCSTRYLTSERISQCKNSKFPVNLTSNEIPKSRKSHNKTD